MAQETMDQQRVRSQVEALFDALNSHDVDGTVALMTDDVLWKDPSSSDPLRGHDAVAERVRAMFRAFGEIHLELHDIYEAAVDAKAASHWRMQARLTGTLDPPGFAPTGRTADIEGACLYEFRDGKFAKHTIIYDTTDMAVQLGLMPSQDSAQSRMMVRMQRLSAKFRRRR